MLVELNRESVRAGLDPKRLTFHEHLLPSFIPLAETPHPERRVVGALI